ncbi:HEAT repeat domain-containing protein [Flavobacterium cerinum]|uniref:HEAT repeat domain-containing protein n=2 Tax=Flavobacterium cerinum TaxID=2502784 RepID=A0A3S3QNX5_9FLAO|nr:HEAT repeat domain-containing protein [Flavobacterium cerinum]
MGDASLDHFAEAKELLQHESYQAGMLGTYIMGQLSPKDKSALLFLRDNVSTDGNWRVQEMLAKAFDYYCSAIGYEKSLQVIKEWLSHENPNTKRAVIEGLRIWTSRPYFKENPQTAVVLISKHKDDASEYLRKSVGNALRDIHKKHKEIVDEELAQWNLQNKNTAFTYKLVMKNS